MVTIEFSVTEEVRVKPDNKRHWRLKVKTWIHFDKKKLVGFEQRKDVNHLLSTKDHFGYWVENKLGGQGWNEEDQLGAIIIQVGDNNKWNSKNMSWRCEQWWDTGMRERKLQGSWSEDPINIELSFTEMGKLVRENSLKVRIICSLLGMLCLR